MSAGGGSWRPSDRPPPMAPPSRATIHAFAEEEIARQRCSERLVSLTLALVLLAGGVTAREFFRQDPVPVSRTATITSDARMGPLPGPSDKGGAAETAAQLANLALERGEDGPVVFNRGAVPTGRTEVWVQDAAGGADQDPIRVIRVGALKPGQGEPIGIPGCPAPRVRYVVDPERTLRESREDDNLLELEVPCPDLVATEEAGSVLVSNVGNATSPETVVELQRIDGPEEITDTRKLAPLKPGQSVALIDACTPGTHVVTVDSTEVVEEFDEDNTRRFEIACADLEIVGQDGRYHVVNRGASPAGGFAVIATSEEHGTVIWSTITGGLAVGERLALPLLDCADMPALIEVDLRDEVTEESEHNNSLRAVCVD